MKQQLEKRIREFVPSLVTKRDRCGGCGYGINFCKNTRACPQFEDYETIQLHHVLLAIEKIKKYNCFAVDYSGRFLETDGTRIGTTGENTEGYYPKWDLTKPFQYQSEEVINFLSEILK